MSELIVQVNPGKKKELKKHTKNKSLAFSFRVGQSNLRVANSLASSLSRLSGDSWPNLCLILAVFVVSSIFYLNWPVIIFLWVGRCFWELGGQYSIRQLSANRQATIN